MPAALRIPRYAYAMCASYGCHVRTQTQGWRDIQQGPVQVADWLLCCLQILLITSITGEASARSSLFAALSLLERDRRYKVEREGEEAAE